MTKLSSIFDTWELGFESSFEPVRRSAKWRCHSSSSIHDERRIATHAVHTTTEWRAPTPTGASRSLLWRHAWYGRAASTTTWHVAWNAWRTAIHVPRHDASAWNESWSTVSRSTAGRRRTCTVSTWLDATRIHHAAWRFPVSISTTTRARTSGTNSVPCTTSADTERCEWERDTCRTYAAAQ